MKTFHQVLQEKKAAFGISMMYPAPAILERIGRDWDWTWIDMQHGQIDYHDAIACVRMAQFAGSLPVVRVSGHDYGQIGLALDMGAAGVMVPMVENVRQAKEIVRAAKFPPLGSRSYGARRVIDMMGRNYAYTANEDVILIAQIENREGLDNIGEIVRVPGIDALFFSSEDISAEQGVRMDMERKDDFLLDELEKLAKETAAAGKLAGMVAATPGRIKIAVQAGYRIISVISDVSILSSGSLKAREKAETAIL